MTGSPQILDFKSCVPKASWYSYSGLQEVLGTRKGQLYYMRTFFSFDAQDRNELQLEKMDQYFKVNLLCC